MRGKVHGKSLGFDWCLWSSDIFRLHCLTREHVAEIIRLQLVGYRNTVGKRRERHHRRFVFLIAMETAAAAVVDCWSRRTGHAQPRKSQGRQRIRAAVGLLNRAVLNLGTAAAEESIL